MYLTRNQAWVYAHRGFESHPLRHLFKSPGPFYGPRAFCIKAYEWGSNPRSRTCKRPTAGAQSPQYSRHFPDGVRTAETGGSVQSSLLTQFVSG